MTNIEGVTILLSYEERTEDLIKRTFSDFYYGLYDKAYNINQKEGYYIKGLSSWGVAQSKNETLYYATIKYVYKDSDVDDKKCSEGKKACKEMMWFEMASGITKEEFEEDLENKLNSINKKSNQTVKEISERMAPKDEPFRYIAIITYTEVSDLM